MSRKVLFLLVAMSFALTVAAGANGNVVASLKGRNEVPPVDSDAQGQAVVKIRGARLSYKLIVANIRDVVAAHIHCAPEDANGPVGVTLYLGAPVSTSGILAQGPILAPDGANGCGWVDVGDVIDAVLSGDTYVNVHTLGTLSGEIRGQIK